MKVKPGGKIIVFTHADAETESEPAAGKHIDGRGLTGEERGVARRSDHATGQKPDAWRRSGRHRQDRKRFERLGNDSIGDDDAGKRAALSAGDPLEHRCAGSGRYSTR